MFEGQLVRQVWRLQPMTERSGAGRLQGLQESVFIQDYYGCTKGFLRKPLLLGPLSCWLLCWHCVSLEVGKHPRSDTEFQLTGCHSTHMRL